MAENNVIRTTCSYCSVGCNFDATIEDGQVKKWMPNKEYPVNLGKSCPKGFHLLKPFETDERATDPLVRNGTAILEPVSWDEALDLMVSKFKGYKEAYGPESVAFLSTGQIPFEEMAFLGRALQVRHGIRPRRRQYPPVHGDRCGHLQTGVRIRRTAVHLRRTSRNPI